MIEFLDNLVKVSLAVFLIVFLSSASLGMGWLVYKLVMS